MSTGRDHVYFADLNCPFCYALDERIQELGLTAAVLWQGVQHLGAPQQGQAEAPELLSEEVNRVRQCSPELTIRVPTVRPSTGPAILALAELELVAVAVSVRLRRALYRALWIEGRDISSAAVIAETCRSIGAGVPKPGASARALVERWQRAWENGGFDGCIPVLVSPSGARSIGLEPSRRVATFLKAGLLNSETDDSCRGPRGS